MSLGVKLWLPVLVTTAILAGVLGAVVTNEVTAQIRAAYDQQAETVAAGVEAMFLQHPADTTQMGNYLGRLVGERSDLISVRIHSLDAGGTVIASSNPGEVGVAGLADAQEMQAIWGGYSFEDENDGPLLTAVSPLKDGDLLFGAVVITSSRSRELAATQSITFGIGLAALVAIVLESLFVLGTLYLGILRRTRRVQRAIEAVARGDTTVRLPEGKEVRGRDEIFNLARSVDRMIVGLNERQRGEALIRRLGQKALQGTISADLISEALTATRESLGFETCIFASVSEDGSLASWRDGSNGEHKGTELPVWVFSLTRVAIEARKAVLTDRFGRQSRFAEEPGISTASQAAIVPLPRTSRAGQALIAIAPAGETIPDGGLAVLDAVAATIAESLHMQEAENARAESAVKSKVMAAVSHEMRNPLNSILGFTALVLGAPAAALTDKQRRQLGYVQTSANNLLTLVNNYLDLARIRSGSLALQYETVKMAPIVADAARAIQAVAEGKNVIVRTSVSDHMEARVDPTRVRQIVANLLSNAVKFTPSGGRVFVRARAGRDECRIVVSDTGVGIPKDQKDLLFSEFSKIDAGTMAAGKGSGLGLALTRAFISAMDGSIKVYSRQGRGTTFVVMLPLQGAATRAASAA